MPLARHGLAVTEQQGSLRGRVPGFDGPIRHDRDSASRRLTSRERRMQDDETTAQAGVLNSVSVATPPLSGRRVRSEN
jgi:hypothetical protein